MTRFLITFNAQMRIKNILNKNSTFNSQKYKNFAYNGLKSDLVVENSVEIVKTCVFIGI